LKTFRQIRILSVCIAAQKAVERILTLTQYTTSNKPKVVPLDDFTLQEILQIYSSPSTVKSKTQWTEWVFQLRQDDRRHALKFMEDWSGPRIALVGSVP
jgi:hypothetical protein